MFVSDGARNGASPHGGGAECVVVDAGPLPFDRRELRAAIGSILDGRVAELARDRNSVCYRVGLSGPAGCPDTAIVKVPRPGPQRTNDDATFSWEAEVLARLPAAGIGGAPALLARVAAAGSHFLFTTELPGKHPDARTHPLDGRQLCAIVDGLYAMDSRFFMHYDLKAANILVDGDRAGFIDFEFARFVGSSDAYAPATAAFCEDFNVSGNPLFPARTNVANFEFRTLHRYLLDLAATRSPRAADDLHCEWLHRRSAYHRRMADCLVELAATSAARVAVGSGIGEDEARRRLHAGAAHENLLATLFQDPSGVVARVERMLMAFRCAVFEGRTDESRELQDGALAAISDTAPLARVLPGAYRKATARTLDLVGRSRPPPS
ncbi:MAG TPA: hypothetical protein VLU54_06800 [Casimicrobiaceae bacterium]|nr:hypothetical protein [Casimicrobiaceae bacterium]